MRKLRKRIIKVSEIEEREKDTEFIFESNKNENFWKVIMNIKAECIKNTVNRETENFWKAERQIQRLEVDKDETAQIPSVGAVVQWRFLSNTQCRR